MIDKKRIFITGIAGFIGFHLAKQIKSKGAHVIGCDNFNPYYSPELKRERAKILQEEGIIIIEKDICERALLQKAVKEQEITHFVHLAAQAGVRYSLKHPESYIHSNLDGFFEVLEVCRSRPNMQFIFASSSSVYGLNEKVPFSENDPTDHPASLYGATKKAGEALAFSYHHLFGIPMRGLRFFTVYGPWGRPDMAYYSFTQAIIKGSPIRVFHEGKMRRDFTYIDDIVQGIEGALNVKEGFEIFNLGNNHPEEVMELISIIEKFSCKKAVIEFLPMQPGDVPVTYADIEKSQKAFGFAPKTTLSEGMEHFYRWFIESKIS